MAHIIHDLRIAIRSLLRHRSFSSIAIVTLALGAGATTAIFSVVYGVVLRPLPYPQPDRLVSLWQTTRDALAVNGGGTVSHVNYMDWKRQARSFESMALYASSRSIVTGLGEPEVMAGGIVTPDFFRVFGATPVIGREFTPDEDRPGGAEVAIVSYTFWRQRMGGRSDVLSQTITLSGRPRQIVGVAPPGFDFPNRARLWLPVRNDDAACGRSCVYLNGIARLAPGVSVKAARQEMDIISRRLEEQFPNDNTNITVAVRTLHEETVGSVRNALVLLLGAVGMVLLIACANVANLLLVRGAARQSDVTVRAALGASRSRIVSHLLMESVVLAAAGGTAGVMLAAWGVEALKRYAPPSIPRLDEVAFDGMTFAFALGVVALTSLLFGLGPAVQLSRVPLSSGFGSRGDVSPRRRWGRSALLAAEVGLSLVLMLGAGLLLRSVGAMQAVDPGWAPGGVATFTLYLPPARYSPASTVVQAHDAIAQRLAAMPGVESVGRINGLPLGRSEDVQSFTRPDRPAPQPGQLPNTLYRVIDAGYFRTLGVALVAGRNFSEADRAGSQPVAVVSRRFAQTFFPGEDPLGHSIVMDRTIQIVGVAADVRSTGLTAPPEPELYVPLAQNARPSLTYVIKSRQAPGQVLGDARAIVQAADSQLPLMFPESMQQVLDRALARPRFYVLLLGLFAVLAVTLAAVGVYGVVAYAVSQRTREIGVRMALGARSTEVIRLVLWQGLQPAGAGLAAGLAVAYFAGRVIRSELYGVREHDPLTFAAVTLFLLGVVIVACAAPARRATRVAPAMALRGD